MIELRKYKRMHVDLYRARALVSARVYTAQSERGGVFTR